MGLGGSVQQERSEQSGASGGIEVRACDPRLVELDFNTHHGDG